MQTWKDREVPEQWKEGPRQTKILMPEYEYTLNTDEDNRRLVADHYPWFLGTFDSFIYPIMRADAIRYMWLHKYGGVYYDLDMCPVKSLEVLRRYIDEECEHDSGLYLPAVDHGLSPVSNFFMASVQGHPFWLAVLREIQARVKGTRLPFYTFTDRHLYVFNTTGPSILSYLCRSGWSSLVTAIPSRILFAYTICDNPFIEEIAKGNPQYVKKESIFRSLGDSSWVEGWVQTWKRLFYCNPIGHSMVFILVMFAVLIVILLVCWRLGPSGNSPFGSLLLNGFEGSVKTVIQQISR